MRTTAKKNWLNEAKESLNQSSFTVEDLTDRLNALLEKTGTKPVVLFSLIRIATTHSPQSPGLFDTLNLLGKEKSIERIEKTLNELK